MSPSSTPSAGGSGAGHADGPPGHDSHAAPSNGFDLVEFSTRRRVTVAMVTVTLLLFGMIALGNLKVSLLPDLSFPTLTVRTEYTGAAPSEIESLVSEARGLGAFQNGIATAAQNQRIAGFDLG